MKTSRSRTLIALGVCVALLTSLLMGSKLSTQAQEDDHDRTIHLPLVQNPVQHSAAPIEIASFASSPNWTYESDQANAQLGITTANIGDVNSDGYDDVAFGAMYYDNGQADEGRVFVFHGSSTGFSSSPDWTGESDGAGARFGFPVASAGDVNDDGYDDLLVGAYNYNGGYGKAYVYHGSSTGLSSSPDWSYEGLQASAYFAQGVASGDVNGDGYSDVLIGAGSEDNGQTNEGRVYAFYGSSSGLNTNPDWDIDSDVADSLFGAFVGSADVNNDGYDDLLVGAIGDSSFTGKAYVFHGSSSGLSSSPDWTKAGSSTGEQFGFSINSAGDIDDDGYDDVAISAPYKNSNTGTAYVFNGSLTGLESTADWSQDGSSSGIRFGFAVTGVGDTDGDGYDDVLISSPYYDNGQTDEGRLYVYSGSSSGLNTSTYWTHESNGANNELGLHNIRLIPSGDYDQNGLADIAAGIPYYDNGQNNEGRALAFYNEPDSISGLAITHTVPVEPGVQTNFTATVTTGEAVEYEWDFVPGNTAQLGSGQSVDKTFVITYTVTVTASNSTNTVSTSKVITFE